MHLPWFWLRLMLYRKVVAGIILRSPLFHKCCCFTASGPISASRAVVSGWACSALVNEREGSGRGFHVVGAELLDAKSAQFNQVVNLSVEMATAAERFPRWS